MMKDFEKDYAAYEELKAAYDKAYEAKDEAGQEAARAGYKVWEEGIREKGEDYARIYKLYEEARKAGNEHIDIHDTIYTRDIEGLVADFREFGVERFTFSSTWSSAVERGWEFIKNGCTLEGMAEINSEYTAFMSDEREKKPAYIFRVG